MLVTLRFVLKRRVISVLFKKAYTFNLTAVFKTEYKNCTKEWFYTAIRTKIYFESMLSRKKWKK